jgi:putative transposase
MIEGGRRGHGWVCHAEAPTAQEIGAGTGQHLYTTNPIESTFATARHSTTRTRNCVSRPTFLGLAFKLIEEAENSWNRIRGADKIGLLLSGVTCKDGIQAQDNPPEQQNLAA